MEPEPEPNPNLQTSSKDNEKQRKFNDVIYDFIYHNQLIWSFIDTPEFQRLRKIKKLECLEYIYPSASHTRFEHQVGSAYLAKLFMNAIIKNNKEFYPQQDQASAIRTVTLAALLLGIGYAPYNHAFQSEILNLDKVDVTQKTKMPHELASSIIFDYMVKNYKHLEKLLTKKEIRRVKSLIEGKLDQNDNLGEKQKRIWEFALVNNKNYGIDVGRLDGFLRDGFYLGAKNLHVQKNLLMNEARIVDNVLCYPQKYIDKIFNIFDTRYRFYKEFAFNTVSSGIEQMIVDILKLIQKRFKFQEAFNEMIVNKNPTEYLRFNDTIIDKVTYELKDIQEDRKEKIDNMQQITKEDDKMLEDFEQAKKIIRRLKTRDIYRYVMELIYYVNYHQVVKDSLSRTQDTISLVKKLEESLEKKNVLIKLEELNKKIQEKNFLMKLEELNKKKQSKVNTLDQICLSTSDVEYGLNSSKQQFQYKQLDDRRGPLFFKIIGEQQQKDPQKKETRQTLKKLDVLKLGQRYETVAIEHSIKLYVKDISYSKAANDILEAFRISFDKDCSKLQDKKLIYIYGKEGKLNTGTSKLGQQQQQLIPEQATSQPVFEKQKDEEEP